MKRKKKKYQYWYCSLNNEVILLSLVLILFSTSLVKDLFRIQLTRSLSVGFRANDITDNARAPSLLNLNTGEGCLLGESW